METRVTELRKVLLIISDRVLCAVSSVCLSRIPLNQVEGIFHETSVSPDFALFQFMGLEP